MACRNATRACFAALFIVVLVISPSRATGDWQAKVDERVLAAARHGAVDVIVLLDQQADLSPAEALAERRARARFVHDALREVAGRTQREVCALLAAAGFSYQGFWVVNAIAVADLDTRTLAAVAARMDVARVVLDDRVWTLPPAPRPFADDAPSLRTVPWHVAQVGAPAVWAAGNTGQDGVIGILDTGCEWTHPAVRDQYRGWNGVDAEHDYNWFDATSQGGAGCGPASSGPCDDHGHGTHVLGAAVGDGGPGLQIGVAPGARWIACRAFAGGVSSPSLLLAGFEWMLAPRPIGGGEGDPDRGPDVITAAWYCTPAQGCAWSTLLPAVAAARAAGIVVVAAAGVTGPDCGTIVATPAIYAEAYTVGATGPDDGIAWFSSRGPATTPQGTLTKPDLTAPGVNVLSSLPGGGYASWSGTATAAAQVAGVVALVLTAAPELSGDPGAIAARLNATAVARTSDQCGDGDLVPNNVYGHGRVDAAMACDSFGSAGASVAPAVRLLPNAPNPFNPRTVLVYELARPGVADLRLFDASGRLVRVLGHGELRAAGRHEVVWDGRDARGREVAAGVYFSLLRCERASAVGRLVLLR